MADTVDTGLLPRTYFKAPRVPFDFRAVALAVLGYLVYWAGGLLLSEIFGKTDLAGSFLIWLSDLVRGVPFIGPGVRAFLLAVFRVEAAGIYGFWPTLVGGVWFFLVWSFFGQAIHRIASLRIARDEGLSVGEALKFAISNWPTILLAPVIIAGAIAFFYGCNALGGLVISIPWIGQVLGLILVPLAVISSLLILLIAVGGIFGLPLIGAAAAWERNGTLDAISRAFSYVFARPLQYFWNYFLIIMFVGIVLLVGSWFINVFTTSTDAGVIFSDELSVMVDPPMDGESVEEFAGLDGDAKELYRKLRDKTGYRDGRDETGSPFAKSFQAVIKAPWSQKLNALVFWLFINLIWLGVFGYAVYWFLGASTSVYADLRADVDGTEEDEIYLEEEEEDFDAWQQAIDESAGTETAEGKAGDGSSESDAGSSPGGDGEGSSDGDTGSSKKDGDTGSSGDEKPDEGDGDAS